MISASRQVHVLSLFLAVLLGSNAVAQQGLQTLRESSRAFASVAQQVSPSVVFIQAEKNIASVDEEQFPFPFGDDFFDFFFDKPLQDTLPRQPRFPRYAVSQGSGILYSPVGEAVPDKTYILTNNHVIAGASSILVTLSDGREFEAVETGTDPRSDIAVLEISARNLPTLPLGDSSALQVGEWVVWPLATLSASVTALPSAW